MRVHRFAVSLLAAGVVGLGAVYTWSAGVDATATPPPPTSVLRVAANATPAGVGLPDDGPRLAPGVEHGIARRLHQYPALALASPRQRARASRLRFELVAAARRFANPRTAEAAGFDLRRPLRRHGSRRVMWFHAENRTWHAARGAALDPAHPDTLIYADLPGLPLRLVGVMISMPRGLRGPTPGGPIMRWHHHLVCVAGGKRGLSPRADGSCPNGSQLRIGSEMLHVWFTHDLRSAFAVHAPVPELCSARLLTAAACASPRVLAGM